jgi:hypothetical protein
VVVAVQVAEAAVQARQADKNDQLGMIADQLLMIN